MHRHLRVATHPGVSRCWTLYAIRYRAVRSFIIDYAGSGAGVVGRSVACYLVSGSAWVAASSHPAPDLSSIPGPTAPRQAGGAVQERPWALDLPLICEAMALPSAPLQNQAPQPGGERKNVTADGAATRGAAKPVAAAVPAALPIAPPIVCEELSLFLEQAAIALGNWAQAMLQSPGRRRRRLRRILDDWGNLFQHALNADMAEPVRAWMRQAGWAAWSPAQGMLEEQVRPCWQSLARTWHGHRGGRRSKLCVLLDPRQSWCSHLLASNLQPLTAYAAPPSSQGPLSTWVEAELAALQATHLLLGWELELYAPQEYATLYWYTSHLHVARSNALRALVETRAPVPAAVSGTPDKSGMALPGATQPGALWQA
jgi:hypothetical protein